MSLTCKCYVGIFFREIQDEEAQNIASCKLEGGWDRRLVFLRGHRATLSHGTSVSFSTLLGESPYWLACSSLQLALGPVASPAGQNSPGPFSCGMHCQLTQCLEFQHSNCYERNISGPHQLVNTGQQLVSLGTGVSFCGLEYGCMGQRSCRLTTLYSLEDSLKCFSRRLFLKMQWIKKQWNIMRHLLKSSHHFPPLLYQHCNQNSYLAKAFYNCNTLLSLRPWNAPRSG